MFASSSFITSFHNEVELLLDDYESASILPIEIKSGNNQNNFRAIPKLVKEPYNLRQGYIFGNENIIEEKSNLITFFNIHDYVRLRFIFVLTYSYLIRTNH